ncbi:P-loop containing nucleoside triphosphate hydrolase protein [Rhizopogon vinicolor AM-OR11-026]|uniref:p-loop containing nucleoside triphosphate hydrolase protein n=1 Tax=Rhizopogon vinicolor AM-OR11-026 TaxID=1314800 RepID=A0A1B7N988_9AGAM|nr:P-loop containing nucleoside triphosphate hydrolase protein [Rhizopogon vinicolor AM-OR11-026]
MDNPQTLEKHSAFQLVSIPSDEEIQLAKDRVQYVEELFHFAVTGVSGAGKSSLINAFRGLRNRDEGAAPTGVVETTMDISRFPDPNPQNPFVWYDVPGSGTLSTPDWQYFNAQGLYVFDCIIILFDTRFTMTDLAMLVNCRRFNIPTYIVRSKSDTHIRNMMKDSGYDSDEDEDHSDRNAMYGSAREQYIAETRATVRLNLQEASLPDQRVYIVAHSTMVSTVRDQTLSEKTIDELELMRDLFREAQSRRCTAAKVADQKVHQAKAAQEKAEEELRKGVQPINIPSAEQRLVAKRNVQYKEGLFHFAVAGVAGSGKSSLVNSIRGVQNRDPGAAATGVIETTTTIGRYPDPKTQNPFVWYDVPGAGTLFTSDWMYFNQQGLYVFDCIIVLWDNRFTMTDIAILTNCRRFKIPSYIVRSKADVHIRNLMKDMGYDSEAKTNKHAHLASARAKYIADTRESVRQNLREVSLPDQRVYIISNETMCSVVQEQTSPKWKAIDELELLRDLLNTAYLRRCRQPESVAQNS